MLWLVLVSNCHGKDTSTVDDFMQCVSDEAFYNYDPERIRKSVATLDKN